MNFELISWTSQEKAQVLYKDWVCRSFNCSIEFASIVQHYKQLSWKELYKERSQLPAKTEQIDHTHMVTPHGLFVEALTLIKKVQQKVVASFQSQGGGVKNLRSEVPETEVRKNSKLSTEFGVKVKTLSTGEILKNSAIFDTRSQRTSINDTLPRDVVSLILERAILSPNDLYKLSLVCSTWNQFVQQDSLWAPLVTLRFSEESRLKTMNWTQLRHHYMKMKTSLISIKLRDGSQLRIDVCLKYDTIKNVKQEIFRRYGISVDKQQIYLKAIEMKDNRFLREYDFQELFAILAIKN